ncbi:hypothetical protein GF319_02145 [Candidatus Bathyarchaeota archaeon]|jgi:uncharacterized membrane protein|nr:hypothetical protein [Candidatus Bathyarchaeota archaeon]
MSTVIKIGNKHNDLTVDNAVIFYHSKVREAHLIYASLTVLGLAVAGLLLFRVSSFSAVTTVLSFTLISYVRLNKSKNRLYIDIINNLSGNDVEHFFRFIDADLDGYLEEMR